MSRQVRWIAIAAGAVIALTACNSGEKEAEPSASPSTVTATTTTPSPTPTSSEESSSTTDDTITGVPTFEYFEACGRPCWLPINPNPKLVDGLALTSEWPFENYGPEEGDSFTVICSTQSLNGKEVQDDRGIGSTSWYEVVVPEDKLSIIDDHHTSLSVDDLEIAPDGGYLGFVPAIWVVLEEGADLMPCS